MYYGRYGYGLWATIFRETGAFIGRCGLLPWEIGGRTEVEVAFLLEKSYWGRGLATEAAEAIVRYAFETLPVDRLICMVDPANSASRSVALKVGMTMLWDDYVDAYGPSHVYAIERPALSLAVSSALISGRLVDPCQNGRAPRGVGPEATSSAPGRSEKPVKDTTTSRTFRRRRAALGGIALAVAAVIGGIVSSREPEPLAPHEVRGSPAWARMHYGNPDARRYRSRNIVQIEFLGRAMFVHRKAAPHFLRLERLFEARAPDYAAAVASGELDDWSYLNRDVRGAASKSNHAFGLAIDINALANPLGTTGDIPTEVVRQWETEGGDWGGDWSRPDPMHFETHLTPPEIDERYRPDGTPEDWYLEELVGGS